MTPLQLLVLANEFGGRTAVVAKPAGERMTLCVAAASFAETYRCPDPTCRPQVKLSTGERATVVSVAHDSWCSELRRRTVKTRAQPKRRQRGKRR